MKDTLNKIKDTLILGMSGGNGLQIGDVLDFETLNLI